MPIPKVLLVDDDPVSLAALQQILLDDGARIDCTLITAGSGAAALALVHEHDFAAILLDVDMPALDGFATAETIHAHPRARGVPIIFLSAHRADDIARLRAYQHGATDYLLMPVIPQVLQAKVRVFVELARKTRQLRIKSEQLARINHDLRQQRVHDLERINRELAQEIVERRHAEQLAHDLSTHDSLTGLLNRRSLLQHLDHAVASAKRRGSEFALMFIDLDRFKEVNDGFGHEVGDELLRQVAVRLSAAVRSSDLLARLGGDEFVVLAEGDASSANAARVARKIEQAHARPYLIDGHRLLASASIGIGLYPRDGDGAAQLMKHADMAMYHAKREQRGGIKFFDNALNLREKENEQWRRELHDAFGSAQFELHYQPVVDIASGRLAWVEALWHWRHPRLGLLNGDACLPQIPDRTLLNLIDDWSMRAVCADAARWRDALQPAAAPTIALKICAPTLQPELVQRLAVQVHKHRLPAGSIELELAAQLLDTAAESALRELRQAGVSLSVDQFGGGSSLLMCKTLQLKALKIAPAFVHAIGDGGADMVAALVHLAHALTAVAVAPGVSEAHQLATLATLGCDCYQGDLYCAPLPADELLARLRGPANAELAPAAAP